MRKMGFGAAKGYFNDFLDSMQERTEDLLTRRKARKERRKRARQSARGEALDWLYSFAYAVLMVFVVSLYLFQLYVIPSESMRPTLEVSDRVGVFKRSYGTELCAFGYKTGKRWTNEGDVIVFYNPGYESKGIVRENLQNFLFLVTFSAYNPSKEGKLYVKRSVGISGDRLFFRNGDLFVQRFSSPYAEAESPVTSFYARRLIGADDERRSIQYGRMAAYSESGNPGLMPLAYYDADALSSGIERLDYFTILQSVAWTRARIEPFSASALTESKALKDGFFLEGGQILPLGDNRDNSQDGRYFGPVRADKIIGRALFRFWPISRTKRL